MNETGKVLQFPDLDARNWRTIEDEFRSQCRAAGMPLALEDYLISRIRRLYEQYGVNAPAQATKSAENYSTWLAKRYMEEILDLEVKLWRAGAPAPVDPGQPKTLYSIHS